MEEMEREVLVQMLHRQREALRMDVAETEADQRLIAGSRSGELEESAQQQCMARLLARLDDGQIEAFRDKDVVQSIEEGIDYVPAAEPPPEER